MAEQTHRIVAADESEIHDEPHIAGSRVSVRIIHERVEEAGCTPESIADRYNLALADIYHALAYYHDHPAEMRRIERKREQAIENHRDRAVTGPDDLK